MEKADVIQCACLAAAAGQDTTARELLRAHYPFQPISKIKRACSLRQSIAIFERDGFIDRYTGTRLVYPGALYLLSALLPEDFPSHRNGKMDRTHLAFWELFPTIDHVVPVACGGADDGSNWVCTSMRSNQIKAHWRLEDLGWTLYPPGDPAQWDGLLAWFRQVIGKYQPLVEQHSLLRRWARAL